jgi:hypothetical protein
MKNKDYRFDTRIATVNEIIWPLLKDRYKGEVEASQATRELSITILKALDSSTQR